MIKGGRKIFAKKWLALSSIRLLAQGVTTNLEQINPNLVVELPQTMRCCMTLIVQTYHRKAAALIDFAARDDDFL